MVITTGYTPGIIRSTAIFKIVMIRLPAGVTLDHLPGHNVVVYVFLMWDIVAGTLRFSGYNFARNPDSFVQTTSSYSICEYSG